MVKREDLLKIFFVYLCLCHVAPGHPCGRNPISRFRPLTRMLGKDINSLLNLLRESNPDLYRQVQAEWRRYADCVGLVDTGYFKRSVATPGEAQGAGQGRGERMGPQLPLKTPRLMALLHSLVGAGAGDHDQRVSAVQVHDGLLRRGFSNTAK